jgi:hypothetical protein
MLLIPKVSVVTVVLFASASGPAFAQSAPFGLMSDMWSMPGYRGATTWRSYDPYSCCVVTPVVPRCDEGCEVQPDREKIDPVPEEPYDPGSGALPPNHRKCRPCNSCAPTYRSSPSEPSPQGSSLRPAVETSLRQAHSGTIQRWGPPQVVKRREIRETKARPTIAKRFPENDGWIPVVETKTASR